MRGAKPVRGISHARPIAPQRAAYTPPVLATLAIANYRSLREVVDGGRLLFGSSRPGGHGQGDIYIATPQAGGRWRVDNVGPPISSGPTNTKLSFRATAG